MNTDEAGTLLVTNYRLLFVVSDVFNLIELIVAYGKGNFGIMIIVFDNVLCKFLFVGKFFFMMTLCFIPQY